MANSYNELMGIGSHSEDAALEGWWPCQDDAGTTVVLDRSSNGRNMTSSVNTSTLSTTGPGGYLPKALNFTLSRYAIASGLSISSNPITLLVRMLSPGTTGNRFALCASNASVGSSQAYVGAEGGLHRYCVRTRNTSFRQAANTVQSAVWKGIGGRESSIDRELFLNGSSVANDFSIVSSFTITAIDLGRLGDTSPSYSDQTVCDASMFSRALTGTEHAQWYNGPEAVYVSGASLAAGGTFDVGTWDLPDHFAGLANGSVTYEVSAVTTLGSVLDTATTSTGTLDLSLAGGATVYLYARATNTGGYDIGDHGTRSTPFGSANDGYYELTSVVPGSGSSFPFSIYFGGTGDSL